MAANKASIQRNLNFNEVRGNPEGKANQLFQQFFKQVKEENERVALIYSCDTKQLELIKHLKSQVKQQEEWGHLEKKAIIFLPIAIPLKGSRNEVGNGITKKSLDADLQNIEDALKDEYTVYGFGNKSRYLIGEQAHRDFYSVQNPLLTIDGVSQGCYLQRTLAQLEQEFGSNNQLPHSGQGEKYSPEHLNTPVNVIKNKLVEITRFYYDEGKRHSSFLNRHGETGRSRALVFLSEMLKLDSRDLIEDKILNFLGDESNGNTHEYSFRTILLKEYFDSKESLAEVSASFNEILEEVSPNLGFEVIP